MSQAERFMRAGEAFAAMGQAVTRSKIIMTGLALMGEAEIAHIKHTLPAEETDSAVDRVIEVYRHEVIKARADLDSATQRFFEGLTLDDLTEGARRLLSEQSPAIYRQLAAQGIYGGGSSSAWAPLPPQEPELVPPGGVHIIGALYHTRAIYESRFKALDDARRGLLAPDWRSRLTVETLHGGPSESSSQHSAAKDVPRPDEYSIQQSDAEKLALLELQAEPPRAWEPGHAPSPEAALNAWYEDALDTEASYGPNAIADHINTVLTQHGHQRIPSQAGRQHMQTMSNLRRTIIDAGYALGTANQADDGGRIPDWLPARYTTLPDYWT